MARTKLSIRTVRVPTKLARATEIKANFDELDDVLDASGTIPGARLNLATAPTNADTVTIGGHVFTFLSVLIAPGVTTQVLIGTAAATRASLVNAINGVTDATVVPATTPHAIAIFADVVDTSRVRIRRATAKGGTPDAFSKALSIALAEGLTAAADVWDRANLNETGKAAVAKSAQSSIAITAAMIAATKVYVEFPFTPIDFSYSVRSATGALLPCSDLVTIEGNAIKIALAGGVAPNLQATDVVILNVTA